LNLEVGSHETKNGDSYRHWEGQRNRFSSRASKRKHSPVDTLRPPWDACELLTHRTEG
jgi:hypothetical protein